MDGSGSDSYIRSAGTTTYGCHVSSDDLTGIVFLSAWLPEWLPCQGAFRHHLRGGQSARDLDRRRLGGRVLLGARRVAIRVVHVPIRYCALRVLPATSSAGRLAFAADRQARPRRPASAAQPPLSNSHGAYRLGTTQCTGSELWLDGEHLGQHSLAPIRVRHWLDLLRHASHRYARPIRARRR